MPDRWWSEAECQTGSGKATETSSDNVVFWLDLK